MMATWQWVVLGVAALLMFWMLGGYNRLMSLRNAIGVAFVQLADALQGRAQAVAPLAQALLERLPGESEALKALSAALTQHDQALAAARAQVTSPVAMSRMLAAEGELASAMLRVQALLDRRGDLAADAVVAAALNGLHAADARTTFTRQLFNQAVLAYNDARALFPTSVLARLFGFAPASAL